MINHNSYIQYKCKLFAEKGCHGSDRVLAVVFTTSILIAVESMT